jgi:hypothetical protein
VGKNLPAVVYSGDRPVERAEFVIVKLSCSVWGELRRK